VPVALLLLVMILMMLAWRTLATHRSVRAARPRHRFIPPDDDPDFIRELYNRTRPADDEQG
jgi:hypothetical protein